MDYHWRCVDARGGDVAVSEIAGAADAFEDQTDAEDWLSENWQALRSAGVDAVTLFEDGSEVYGPMSLHPAS